MSEQWLIDGYNLLHSLNSLGSFKTLSREGLLSMVAGFASFQKTDVLLVLDGIGSEAELASYATAHFKAVFSQKDPADTYIERYLFEYRTRRALVVVTDDRAIANIGRGGGARVLSTSVYAKILKDTMKENQDLLRKEEDRGHGFNRPFGDKLKDL